MRSFDSQRLNYLVNHPEIRPSIGGDGTSELDLSHNLLDWNYFLEGEFGGFLLNWSAPATFEVHTFILPEGRGGWALEFAEKAINYMITEGVTHMWTRVPKKDRHTRLFTLKMGFVPCGSQTLDMGFGPVEYELFDWRSKCQQPS